MKLRPIQGWAPRWLPLLGVLIVIGIAFDLVTRSRLSATPAALARGSTPTRCRCSRCAPAISSRDRRASTATWFAAPPSTNARSSAPTASCAAATSQASELGSAFAYEVSRQRHLPAHQRARRRLARGDRRPAPHRRRARGVQAGRGQAADRARRARRLRAGADRRFTRVAVDPLLDAAILKANQKLTVLPYKIGKSAGLRQGNAVEVRGFPLGVMQAVVERQGREPLRSGPGAGLGPRRLRHRRAAVGGELGQPGAGGLLQVARSGAGRRLSRRLQGARRAQRRGRDRPADRVHAQEEAHAARLATEGGPGASAAADRARVKEALEAGTLPLFDFGGLVVRVERPTAVRSSITSTAGSSRSTIGGWPVIEDLPKERRLRRGWRACGFGDLGRLWVPGRRLARVAARARWAPRSTSCSTRVGDSIRLQILHTVDYRQALANPGSAEERRRGRDLSRAIARDVPVARDLAANLLETVDRLSSAATIPPPPVRPWPSRSPLRGAAPARVAAAVSPRFAAQQHRRTPSVAPVSCSACA